MEDLKTRLMNASTQSRLMKRQGLLLKQVLTLEEAAERVNQGKGVSVYSSMKHNAVFFTDDYCMGVGVPEMKVMGFVPSSTYLPMNVVKRDCLPDGIVDTIEKYLLIFEKDRRVITSLDELVEFLSN